MTVVTGNAPASIPRWAEAARMTRTVAQSARLVGLLTILAVVFRPVAHRLGHPVVHWLDPSVLAHVVTSTLTVGAGIGLVLVGTGLRRRKHRAWQVAVGLTVFVLVLHVVSHRGWVAVLVTTALLVLLVIRRERFVALPDPVMGRWPAVAVFAQLLGIGAAADILILVVNRSELIGDPSLGQRVEQVLLALVGVSGPLVFRHEVIDDLTATIGGWSSIGAVLVGGYFLLRSAEPRPTWAPDDESRVRALLDGHGRADSLGYFALRGDKSVVFSPSGKAAVAYRVLAGVALCSGDPLGDAEAWSEALKHFLHQCVRHAWTPAVLGCSQRGATEWARQGLAVLELGDEGVVAVESFTLAGRRMRGVRQAVARIERAGYSTRVRRAGELTGQECARLDRLARSWRRSGTERGFSMALSRVAGPRDPDCVLVTAERDGAVRGILQFVPWGSDGLSLDLMCRDPDSPDNGLTEFMITELLAACPALRVRRVSLNFAVFRAALERGSQLGAGPVARLWAAVLRAGSRWWQIESLYRFNDKFAPAWVPRYLVFPTAADLPRIVLAALEAEGFGGRPHVLLRLLLRSCRDTVS
jgi:lysyl-tRNA synthetase, class II